MATKAGLSNERVSVIWPTISLAPHHPESFQISTGPHFVEKVRDVVGLYMSPPNNALVLSLNVESQCQALERSPPLLPCCQVVRLNAPAMIISATAPSSCLPP